MNPEDLIKLYQDVSQSAPDFIGNVSEQDFVKSVSSRGDFLEFVDGLSKAKPNYFRSQEDKQSYIDNYYPIRAQKQTSLFPSNTTTNVITTSVGFGITNPAQKVTEQVPLIDEQGQPRYNTEQLGANIHLPESPLAVYGHPTIASARDNSIIGQVDAKAQEIYPQLEAKAIADKQANTLSNFRGELYRGTAAGLTPLEKSDLLKQSRLAAFSASGINPDQVTDKELSDYVEPTRGQESTKKQDILNNDVKIHSVDGKINATSFMLGDALKNIPYEDRRFMPPLPNQDVLLTPEDISALKVEDLPKLGLSTGNVTQDGEKLGELKNYVFDSDRLKRSYEIQNLKTQKDYVDSKFNALDPKVQQAFAVAKQFSETGDPTLEQPAAEAENLLASLPQDTQTQIQSIITAQNRIDTRDKEIKTQYPELDLLERFNQELQANRDKQYSTGAIGTLNAIENSVGNTVPGIQGTALLAKGALNLSGVFGDFLPKLGEDFASTYDSVVGALGNNAAAAREQRRSMATVPSGTQRAATVQQRPFTEDVADVKLSDGNRYQVSFDAERNPIEVYDGYGNIANLSPTAKSKVLNEAYQKRNDLNIRTSYNGDAGFHQAEGILSDIMGIMALSALPIGEGAAAMRLRQFIPMFGQFAGRVTEEGLAQGLDSKTATLRGILSSTIYAGISSVVPFYSRATGRVLEQNIKQSVDRLIADSSPEALDNLSHKAFLNTVGNTVIGTTAEQTVNLALQPVLDRALNTYANANLTVHDPTLDDYIKNAGLMALTSALPALVGGFNAKYTVRTDPYKARSVFSLVKDHPKVREKIVSNGYDQSLLPVLERTYQDTKNYVNDKSIPLEDKVSRVAEVFDKHNKAAQAELSKSTPSEDAANKAAEEAKNIADKPLTEQAPVQPTEQVNPLQDVESTTKALNSKLQTSPLANNADNFPLTSAVVDALNTEYSGSKNIVFHGSPNITPIKSTEDLNPKDNTRNAESAYTYVNKNSDYANNYAITHEGYGKDSGVAAFSLKGRGYTMTKGDILSIKNNADNEAFLDKKKAEGYDYVRIPQDGNNIAILNNSALTYKGTHLTSESIAKEYHAAKADGSNPELVRAVENLLMNDISGGKQENAPNAADIIQPAKPLVTKESVLSAEGAQQGEKVNSVKLGDKVIYNGQEVTVDGVRGSLFTAHTEDGSPTGLIHPNDVTKVAETPPAVTQPLIPVEGITQAANTVRRENASMPDYEKSPQTFEQWTTEAEKLLKEGYDVEALLSRIQQGHDPNPTENAIRAIYQATLDAEIAKNPTDELLAKYRKAAEIGDEANSRAGRNLGSLNLVGTPLKSLSDYYVARMQALKVDTLTDQQKAETAAKFEKFKASDESVASTVKQYQNLVSSLRAENEILRQSKAARSRAGKARIDYAAERSTLREELRVARAKHLAELAKQGIHTAGVGFTLTTDMAKIIAKIARSHVNEGIDKLSEVINKAFDDIKDIWPEITKDDIQNVLAGDYREKRKPISELTAAWRDIQDEAGYINKLAALIGGEIPKKESAKTKRNQQIADLQDKIKEFNKTRALSEDELRSRLAAVKSKNEQRSEQLKKEIERVQKGEGTTPKRLPIMEDPEMKKRFPKEYNAALDAIKQREDDKHALDIAILEDEMSKRTFWQKVENNMSKAVGTIKAVTTGLDDSAVAIQTYVALLTHPISGAKALKLHAEQALSQKKFDRYLTELHTSPDFKLMQDSGLQVSEPQSLLASKKEEIFNNKFKGTVIIKGKEYNLIDAPLRPFERAFTALGNAMRVTEFRVMAEKYMAEGYTFENDPELFKSLANRLNTETGRGQQNKYVENANKLFSAGIWSPKLMAAKLNILGISDVVSFVAPGLGTKGYYRQLHPKERAMAAKDLAKFALAVAAITYGFALAFGGKVDKNPLSSTFMDVKLPNGKSYNFTGGFSGYMRAIAQFAAAKVNKPGGTVKHNRFDTAGRFFRGKTPPLTGIGLDVLSGSDFMGNPATVQNEFSKTFPISASGIGQQLERDGTLSLLTEGVPTFAGFNIKDKRDYNFGGDNEFLASKGIEMRIPDKSIKEGRQDGKKISRKLTPTEYKDVSDLYYKKVNDWVKTVKENNPEVDSETLDIALKKVESIALVEAKDELRNTIDPKTGKPKLPGSFETSADAQDAIDTQNDKANELIDLYPKN